MAVLDAVTEMVAPKHADAHAPATPEAEEDVVEDDDAVISDVGKAIEMVDITRSQKLHPRILVVALSEALLNAAVRVVGAAKQREGVTADEGLV